MIFDTHSHCYFESLLSDIDGVYERARAAGVMWVVQIGCDTESSIAAIDLARKYAGWSATVGYHPVDAQDPSVAKNRAGGKVIDPEALSLGEGDNSNVDWLTWRAAQERELRDLISKERDVVVAVGETGLDNHYLSPEGPERDRELERQHYWFQTLAQIARDFDLPLIIHSRDARRETIDAIREYGVKRAVIHCFSENYEFARELMEWSDEIYFSFSGIVTYKNALEIQDAATRIPLNRILVETDAPYLHPAPNRSAVNEPARTAITLAQVQSLRSESPELVEQTIYENSLQFYRLTDIVSE